ncbi:MAG TPA: hypothetical protein VNW73_16020 [Ktedonobacteraceae bacterium]|nr:hypothetical protein [Ktedonobacteraceae bacterium]
MSGAPARCRLRCQYAPFAFVEWHLFLRERLPRNKVLGLGFIDVKEPNVEKPEEVANRIRRVLDAGIVPPERLLVMPDCGLGYMSRTVAAAKLKAMGDGVKMVREGL